MNVAIRFALWRFGLQAGVLSSQGVHGQPRISLSHIA